MLSYPDANQWSTTHYVQVSTVNPAEAEAANGLRPAHFEMIEQTHVYDKNLKKKPISEYKRNSKNKSQEYAKFLVNKKVLITIIFGQCDEAIKAKITLGKIYTADCQARNFIKFVK